MNCETVKQLQHAWIDRELGPAESRAFAEHLASCSKCTEQMRTLTALKRDIKAQTTYHALPPGLYDRIAAQVAPHKANTSSGWLPLKWGSFGAVTALAACLAFLTVTGPSQQYVVEQELVTSHIRSLQAGHLTDVVSTDQHTVKPWFNGRTDLSPPVVDLAKDGFPLVGGRLDYIGHHNVAALVYKYNKHIINLYVWPTAAPGPEKSLAQQGYNLRSWRERDLQFWAVTDANMGKLAEFEKTYREQTGH